MKTDNISIERDIMKLEKRLRELPKKGRGGGGGCLPRKKSLQIC